MASPAHAALVGFNYQAVVTSNINAPGVSNGDTITGSFFYDTSIADSSGLSTLGVYPQNSVPEARITFNVGSFAETAQVDLVTVVNTLFMDSFAVSGTEICGISKTLGILLLDSSASVFSSDSIPVALALADFDSRTITYVTTSLRGFTSITGQITSLTSVPSVPLPPAGLLFVSALLLLAGRIRCSSDRA